MVNNIEIMFFFNSLHLINFGTYNSFPKEQKGTTSFSFGSHLKETLPDRLGLRGHLLTEDTPYP